MKRFTMLVALLLMVAMPVRAERVTPETARKVAATFLTNNGAKSSQLTDLSKTVGFTNLYIFNGDEGFVVMAADDCVQPILGYSLTGEFVAENMPTNISSWLQGYNDEIQYAIDNKLKATSETAKLWKDLANGNSKAAKATTVVAPLIQTRWSQNGIGPSNNGVFLFNNLCPTVASGGHGGHAFTGCVATAMAQIMKYWDYPSHGIGSHSYLWNEQTLSADFGSTTYDWDNMTNTYSDLSTSIEKNAVDLLMYHCGVSVNMNYGGNSSSSFTTDVVYALKNYFNYDPSLSYKTKSSYTSEAWNTIVKAELDSERPLQYRGSGSGGHSFVCDGYDSEDFFHFNWGWAGLCDGFYSLSSLVTIDPGTGGGNGVFTNGQAAIFGIQPTVCNASEPSDLSYSLNGPKNITLNWTAANGAASYNIYCNNSYVGNSTTNSYATTASLGANSYYVRSVDGAGNLSLSSNTVSFYLEYQQPIVDDLQAIRSEDNVTLSWTAPEWCYPEHESGLLTYGDGTFYNTQGYGGQYHMYWGHRYPVSALTSYNNMKLYKVSFYAAETGEYQCIIYKGTMTYTQQSNGNEYLLPVTEIANIPLSATQTGWVDIDLNEPIEIDCTQDLWVYMADPEFKYAPASFCNFTSSQEGNYCTSGVPTNTLYLHIEGVAWLIRTFLTDGTYTYNLYQDGTQIAEGLDQTTYNATLNNNAANLFSVKTNYYGGETDNSNKIGFAKGNATQTTLSLNENDQMTVIEGCQLTVSGTLNNDNAENLILEDGARLVHSSEGVKATVMKNIVPYTTDDNGWHFIASPVTETITPGEENGFLNGTVGVGSNTYDLYDYDEPTHYWINYESGPFGINHKKGYLYANGESGGTTLQFAGTLAPSNSSISIGNLNHSGSVLNGFNLVGNPFACNATIDQDCYVIEGRNVVLAADGKVFSPCEGTFVKATDDDFTVTFTKSTDAKARGNANCLDLVVTQGKTILDRARIRSGKGISMEKIPQKTGNTSISLLQNGQEYAVAFTNDQKELTLNFNAAKNDTYTLSVEKESLELDYLHLIDNLTGYDIDLLVAPNYTFEAHTTDYSSRFRLVFSPNLSERPETFAYVNNGEIIIQEQGFLQIIDMMGHVVATYGEVLGKVSMANIASGVYVLRLMTANGVKTQKIVIE